VAHSVFYRVGAALDDVGMDVHVWDMIGFHRNFDKSWYRFSVVGIYVGIFQ
jgi:hypothetical protein